MDQSATYGQMDFSLPHDVVQLPTGGIFYKSKKKSVKVGYLTASDENILIGAANSSGKDGIVISLLRNKIYEPDLRPEELLNSDVEAILIFLRNTAFGSEYKLILRDPKTLQEFEVSTQLDELNIKKPLHHADVLKTHGSNKKIIVYTKINKFTSIKEGISKTVRWYLNNKNFLIKTFK